MPRSKRAVKEQKTESEAAKPENVAARALSHKAERDIEKFLVDLQVECAKFAGSKLNDFLPHIEIKKTSLYGIVFTRGRLQDEEHPIKDLLLAALDTYVPDLSSSKSEFKIAKDPRFSDTPLETYLFRERTYALAQALLNEKDFAEEDDDDDFLNDEDDDA